MRVRTARIPTGYRELEYIEGSGTQYIDSGINVGSIDEIHADFTDTNPRSPYTPRCIMGAGTPYFGFLFTDSTNYKNIVNTINCAPISKTSITLNEKHHLISIIRSGYQYLKIDNYSNTTTSTYSSTPSLQYCIFRINSSNPQYWLGRLYYLKIYNNSELKYNLIPCERQSDGKPGLYDTVNQQFYTNNGTGEFIKGPYKDSYNCPVIIQEGTTNLFGGRADFSDGTKWLLRQINSALPTLDGAGNMTLYGYSTSGNTQSYAVSSQGGNIPIQSSTTYTLSMLVKYSSTTAYFNYYFYEKNSSGTTIKTNAWRRLGCTASEVGHWVLRSKTITTQSNTASMYAELNCYQNPATDYIIVKNKSIQLEAKDHATPFVDGTRPDNYIVIGNPKILIAEGTTNYGRMYQTITPISSDVASDWTFEKLDRDTLKVTAKVNNPRYSTYGNLCGIGGTVTVQAGNPCTLSCEVVDFKGSLSRIYPCSGGFGTILYHKYAGRYYRTITHTTNWTHDLCIRTSSQSDIQAGDYLIVRFTQIELKDHPTPYTPSTRPDNTII